MFDELPINKSTVLLSLILPAATPPIFFNDCSIPLINNFDLLEFASEELLLGVVPGIMSVHEDYFLYEQNAQIVAGKSEYEIPSRAIGNKLRDVQYSSGPGQLQEMTRVGIGERFNDSHAETGYKKFYIKNNKVVLTSTTDSNQSG